jgi:hypothetical protein
MSRPRKRKLPPPDRRPESEGELPEHWPAVLRQKSVNQLRVDPKGDEPLSGILGDVILCRASADDEDLAGKMFLAVLKAPDPSVAEQFFRRVMRLKLNAVAPHRNAFAYYAYGRFIEDAGREPSKTELRAYIEARRNEFKEAPGEDDPKGWTRLWKESGLSGLATR